MKPKFIIALVALTTLLLIGFTSYFELNEREQALVLRLGKIVSVQKEAGIHFKIPGLDDVKIFERRILDFDGDPTQITTRDKKYLLFDTFGRWYISDASAYYLRVGNENSAINRIADACDGATRTVGAENNANEIIQLSDDYLSLDPEFKDTTTYKVLVGRDSITKRILYVAQGKLDTLGIRLVDIRAKRVIFKDEVLQRAYARMNSERNKVAQGLLSAGQGILSEMRGKIVEDSLRIISNAFKLAEVIRGKAEREAAQTYNDAYNSSNDRREFYKFIQAMEFYEESIRPGDVIVLSTDNPLMKYFTGE